MRRRAPLVAAVAGLLLARAGEAQIASSPHLSWTGRYGYTVTGASLRPNPDNSNECAMTGSGEAMLAVPAGATIAAAWVYWAGSGTPDWQVKFNGVDIAPQRQGTDVATLNGSPLSFFYGAREVTSLVRANAPNDLSQLAVTNNGAYCAAGVMVGGWALAVVYTSPTLPMRTVQVRDGFAALHQGSTLVSLAGFREAPAASLTLVTWESDPGIVGTATNPETVRLNGTTLGAADNAFAGDYGIDIQSHSVGALLGAADAQLQLSTGPDLVLPNLLVTQIDAGMVDVTPKGLVSPVMRLPGGSYAQQFQVESRAGAAEGFDLIARAGGGVLTVDSITGPGVARAAARPDSARATLAANETRTVTVWYSVAPGAGADGVLFLRARSTRLPTATYATSEGWAEIRRASPQLTLAKTVTPSTDIAPGTELTYEMTAANAGDQAATGIVVRDEVPTQVDFKVGSAMETLPAGITSVVSYSADGGATWTYVPVSGGCGAPTNYDRCVRTVRWSLTGSLAPGGAATAAVRFVARVP